MSIAWLLVCIVGAISVGLYAGEDFRARARRGKAGWFYWIALAAFTAAGLALFAHIASTPTACDRRYERRAFMALPIATLSSAVMLIALAFPSRHRASEDDDGAVGD